MSQVAVNKNNRKVALRKPSMVRLELSTSKD